MIQVSQKETIKNFFQFLNEQKVSDAVAILSEDLDWWILGNIPVSGNYDKRKITLGFKMLHRNFENFTFTLGPMTEEEDRLSVVAESNALRKSNGKKYNNHYHFLFQFKDGKVLVCKEYFDTVHAVWIEES